MFPESTYFTAQGGIGSTWGREAQPPRIPDPADRPPPPDELRRWSHMVAERVKSWTLAGRLRWPAWFGPDDCDSAEFRRCRRSMLNDPLVKAPALGKVLAVAQLELQTHARDRDEPRQQEAAEFVRDCLNDCSAFDLIFGMGVGETMDGWAVGEPVWESAAEGRWVGRWVWKQIKWKDTGYLRVLVDPYLTVTGIESLLPDRTVWDPQDFLIARHLSLFENPYGSSDWRAAYRAWVTKTQAWEMRSLGLHRWAQPFLVGTYPPGMARAELDAALERIHSNTWLSVPKDCVVEAISVGGSGESDFKGAIADLNDEIVIGIAGATLTILTSQQSDPRGDSAVQKSTTQLFQWALAAGIADVLTRQASPQLTRANYWGVPPPVVTLGAVDEAELAARLANDKALAELGLALSKKETYRHYGRQEPAEPGDALGGSSADGGPGGPGGPGGGKGAPPGALPFGERDRRLLRRIWRAYCDHGPNKGRPGVCPGEGGGGIRPSGRERTPASPRAAVGKELEAAHPPGKDWAKASAAAAITDALARPDPPAVPTNPAAPPEGQARLALRAVKVLDDQDFTRSRLATRAADEVAAGHPDGLATLGEARQRAGLGHAAAAAQVNDHARSLAGALPDPPADRPLGRADLRGGHVIDTAGADPAVREAAAALAAKLPHAAAGESRVAVADTPAAKAALQVLTQLGAAQPLGEGTAEAQAARRQILEGLTEEQRRALRG
jgi:Protein of unknown function (DUF935)